MYIVSFFHTSAILLHSNLTKNLASSQTKLIIIVIHIIITKNLLIAYHRRTVVPPCVDGDIAIQ